MDSWDRGPLPPPQDLRVCKRTGCRPRRENLDTSARDVADRRRGASMTLVAAKLRVTNTKARESNRARRGLSAELPAFA